MTDTTREKIKQVLTSMVQQYRYVFWYDEGGQMKEVTMRFGFYDQAGNLLSDSITLTFSSTSDDSTQREQKHRFMFKRQLSELNGQEIYLRKEQQVAGSSQFKKLEDIAYKVSVLFIAEF